MQGSFGSFGALRLLLAVCVVFSLLGPWHFYLGVQGTAGLILLSGYISSAMFTTRFQQRRDAVKAFAIYRFLRVVPLYVVMFVIAVAIAFSNSDATRAVSSDYYFLSPFESWANLGLWLQNLLIVPLVHPLGKIIEPVFVTPYWAVATEIVLWAVTPWLLRNRDLRVLVTWAGGFFAGCDIVLWWFDKAHSWNAVLGYGAFSAVLPYMMGMWIYLKKQQGWRDIPLVAGGAVFALYVLFFVYQLGMGVEVVGAGWLISLLLGTGVVYFCAQLDARRYPRWLAKLDGVMGELSFPMIVSAAPLGALIIILRPDIYHFSEEGRIAYNDDWGLLLITLPFVPIMATMLLVMVERPARAWRRRVDAGRRKSF